MPCVGDMQISRLYHSFSTLEADDLHCNVYIHRHSPRPSYRGLTGDSLLLRPRYRPNMRRYPALRPSYRPSRPPSPPVNAAGAACHMTNQKFVRPEPSGLV